MKNYIFGLTLSATLGACTVGLDTAIDESTEEVTSATQAVTSCSISDLKITRLPLNGTNGVNWMINNYTDLDTTTGLRDYVGFTGTQARTYDGHRGVDFDIPTFREMDNGSAIIYSVTPGVVEEIAQTAYDRNTSMGNFAANYVVVRHANGYRLLYWHMKRNSVRVAVGQTVVAGTALGVVGSSGSSTAPHLHFEVQDCGNNGIETFSTSGVWSSPPAYTPTPNVMDVVLRSGTAPSESQIKDPAANVGVVKPSSMVGIGLSLATRGTDTISIEMTSPTAVTTNIVSNWSPADGARLKHRYVGWQFNIGNTIGAWTIGVRVNGTLRASRSVNVSTVDPGFTQVARHSIAAADYQGVFNDITAAGYRPVYVDGYEVGSAGFFNALFQPSNLSSAARHDLTTTAFQSEHSTWTSRGYRLVQVDSYLRSGQLRLAAIWNTSTGAQQVSYVGVSAATHQSNFNTYVSLGYRPVNVTAVNLPTGVTFTALYDKANVGSFATYTGLTTAEYEAQMVSNRNAGRRLAYVDVFMVSGQPRFSAIWNQLATGSWAEQHGLTSGVYQSWYNSYASQGYLVRSVSGYESSGSARFAALWTTN